MENAIVAAESMGLGTCCIGGIRQASLSFVKELNLPKYVFPVIGLCLGYPDDDPGIKPRLSKKLFFLKENMILLISKKK